MCCTQFVLVVLASCANMRPLASIPLAFHPVRHGIFMRTAALYSLKSVVRLMLVVPEKQLVQHRAVDCTPRHGTADTVPIDH
jgi:hypothetical protein